MIFFKTSYGSDKIEKVEVVRETKKCVYLQTSADQERRFNKSAEWGSYFSSWESAHKYILEKAHNRLESARRNLQVAQATHGNIKGMKAPK